MGQIIYDAKCFMIQQYFPEDSLYGTAVVYTTFGDPALRIKYPVPGVSEQTMKQIEAPFILPIGRYLKIPASGRITVYNILGSTVIKNLKVEKGEQIRLKSGVYFVRFKDQQAEKIVKVVITERD